MKTDDLIQTLGYASSPHFLRPDAFGQVPEHAHVFRRAAETCGVQGVYLLRRSLKSATEASTPAVYIAEASSGVEADKFHRRVWNQNVVPLLVVRTPSDVRLYSGFEYRRASNSTPPEQRGVLEASIAFGDVLERLSDLRAQSIDDGTVWRTLGRRVDPATRVDWKLLAHLKTLGKSLRSGGEKLSTPVAHALIGKFVYLRYLRDRGILSHRKLERLGIDHDAALSRNATVAGVRGLVEAVDGWLNGTIFPFPFTGGDAPRAEHLRQVAGVFLGDDPESGQLHLDFRAYDFSFIPVETLSVIYEQFLSAEVANREKGAYYTPIHLVNFMLSELDGMRMIEPRTAVLDPSCGSGAFLVQCYRRIVERHLAAGGRRRASDLRELLVSSIYGVDRDEDACLVTALSLTLAMLDYIDPPDLENTPQFKLPNLVGENIFVGDFFEPDAEWAGRQYDIVVGNPPWIQAGEKQKSPARTWMNEHAKTHPVTNNEVAEAFAWKAMKHVAPGGATGLLLPAMTLFKDSTAFRARYFSEVDVAVVANFTNFRRDLFHKAETPAAALFSWGSKSSGKAARDSVIVFSPLVANQPANRTEPGSRCEPWNITINNSEVQQISRDRIREGDMLPWKVAMWGGPRDMHLLRSMRQLPTLDAFVGVHELVISEGLQLREQPTKAKGEAVDPLPDVAGMAELNVYFLKNVGRVYALPPKCLKYTVPPTRAFVRKGRARLPFSVCHAPHVIVSGARTFATFSDEPFVIPPRHIGIGGGPHQTALLKALALYLNSDFAVYFETFKSPQGGVREGRSILAALKNLPVPLDSLTPALIGVWAEFYDALADTQRKLWNARDRSDALLHAVDDAPLKQRIAGLEIEANEAVAVALGLKDEERVLVRDFVHVRKRLADGLVPDEAVGRPTKNELEAYARRLGRTLDRAITENETRRHDVRIVTDRGSGMVGIELSTAQSGSASRVFGATGEVGRAFAKVRQRMTRERGQWLYFDRNLFLFDGRRTFLLKPMQRLWWTEAQALADADRLVAAALAPMDGN